MMMINKWKESELKYENPILKTRREQLDALDWNRNPVVIKKIFESLPKNFRKIFMYDTDFNKANEVCGEKFIKNLKKSLKYCIEVIG